MRSSVSNAKVALPRWSGSSAARKRLAHSVMSGVAGTLCRWIGSAWLEFGPSRPAPTSAAEERRNDRRCMHMISRPLFDEFQFHHAHRKKIVAIEARKETRIGSVPLVDQLVRSPDDLPPTLLSSSEAGVNIDNLTVLSRPVQSIV